MSKTVFMRLILLALCASLSSLTLASVSANTATTVSVTPGSTTPGALITLTGFGYNPGGYIGSILWDGELLKTFMIPSGGNVNESVTVPLDANSGAHAIEVCSGNPCLTGEFAQSAGTSIQISSVNTNRVDDFYYANGKEISSTVSLDQIGVIAQEGVDANQISKFADSLGLKFNEEVAEQMFLLDLFQPLERGNLVRFIRDVRNKGKTQQILRDAGLVLRGKADTTPMLVSDEFVALFSEQVSRNEIDNFNAVNSVESVRSDPFVKNQFILRVTSDSALDALNMANKYEEDALTEFAHADFWVAHERLESVPTDPFFGNQWHHRNSGASSGVVDADADTSWAWDITTGSSSVLIAVLDDGMELTHEDLAPNLFTNSGEIPGNGLDDDGNGFIDDVNGWDFGSGDNNPNPSTADDNHGTAVAGVAAARSNNDIGVSGSCPNCRIIPIRICCTVRTSDVADAFAYAQLMGADVINNSWGQRSPLGVVPTDIARAINNAASAGSIIFFAAGNQNASGWCGSSYPSLNSVIAVSSSTNFDTKAVGGVFNGSAIGNCVDILAPSAHGDTVPANALGVVTTDRTGANGYNTVSAICPPWQTEPSNSNYTSCFGGTSSASPLAAGIAGLIRSVNSTMSRVEVQRLIQDTADKIVPSVANYSTVSGFSTPASGIATHSWGRINAYEAVRIAAPVANGGKGGVDIFMRDNELDWGNTTGYQGEQNSSVRFESPRGWIPWWQSVDIKIDSPAGGYQSAPTTSLAFDALVDENPQSSQLNRVYVRVRNRGSVTASAVTVKLHWAFAGTGLPGLPADFWTAFPADSTDTTLVHPLSTMTITNLAYSGSSIAGTTADVAQIVQFDFLAPAFDPSQPNPDHYCLFAVVSSVQDPVDANTTSRFVIDSITPNDNNITHRNVHLEDTGTRSGAFTRRFFVRNPYSEKIQTRLLLDAPFAQQQGWQFKLEPFGFDQPFTLEANEEVLVTLTTETTKPGQSGEVTVFQERLDTPITPESMGGMTYRFEPRTTQRSIYLPLISK